MDWLTQLDATITRNTATLGWPGEALVRLVVATICGGLVGIEREVRGRQAGFRTNLLVALGSALVMVVSVHFARIAWASPDAPRGVQISVDPSRIAYGVMTGIGFLGAGAIMRSDGGIHGLTTAAGLWCVAAVGLAAGLGMYVVAAGATLLVLAALWLLGYLERLLPKVRYRTIVVRHPWEPGCVAATVARVRAAGARVTDASFVRTGDLTSADVTLRVAFSRKADYQAFAHALQVHVDYVLLSSKSD